MATTAWPFGVTRASLPRINFRWPRGEDERAELSRRAVIEQSFRTVDTAFAQIDSRLAALEAAVAVIEARLATAGIP